MSLHLLDAVDNLWFYIVETENSNDVYEIRVYDKQDPECSRWLARLQILGRGCRVVMFEDLFVEEFKRGQGIGKQLVEKAIAYTKDDGAQTVELSCYLDSKPFYEKLGFRELYKFPPLGCELAGGRDFYRMVYPGAVA